MTIAAGRMTQILVMTGPDQDECGRTAADPARRDALDTGRPIDSQAPASPKRRVEPSESSQARRGIARSLASAVLQSIAQGQRAGR